MKYKRAIINSMFFLIFLSIGLMVKNSSEGILFDVELLEFFHNLKNPVVFKIMKSVSFFGSEKFLIPIIFIIIILNLIKKNNYNVVFLLINTLGSFTLNFTIKQLFQRTRPFNFSLVKQSGLSYPSGHSMVAMSMYLAIFWILTRSEKRKIKKIILGSVLSSYILLIGISRLYLGVHWPTDIIGGYICGYLIYNLSKIIVKE